MAAWTLFLAPSRKCGLPSPLFKTALSCFTMTFRRYLILAIVTLTSSLGDTFLSVGMKRLGPVSLHHLDSLLVALRMPWILAGILLLLGFFASYLTALSWADLTYVLPATSLGYVLVAVLSRFWMHEQISTSRWLGIFFIVAGVGFVTRGPAYTETHPCEEAALALPSNGAVCHREREDESIASPLPLPLAQGVKRG
jgi:drug/metabolite transporter (DMT)-like permease